jgi:polyhydroxyalkanoate synthesis repressor PhaR
LEKLKTIKRYSNRRLYDSDTSQTITLEDLAEFIKDGYQIKIIDNISGNDITPKILGQVFLKVNLGGLNNEFNVYLLTSLIREGTKNIHNLFRRLVKAGVGAANLTRSRIENMVDEMVEQGQITASDRIDYINELFQNAAEQAEKFKEQITQKAQKMIQFDTKNSIENLSQKVHELANAIKEIQDNNAKPKKK